MTHVRGLLLFVVAALASCGGVRQEVQPYRVAPGDPTLTALSAGSIGCPPREIGISECQGTVTMVNGTLGGSVLTWSAKCRGRQFYCSRPPHGQLQCSELLPER